MALLSSCMRCVNSLLIASRGNHSSALLAATKQVDKLLEMGKIVIPEPLDATEADLVIQETLLPFTWDISAYRNRSLEDRGLIVHYKPQAAACPPQRSPSDSFLSITYPFTTNEALRDQYQRFSSPYLRAGLVLEDMDSFAADVATRHLGGLPPGMTVVTATVDKVCFATARAPPAAPEAGRCEPGSDAPQQQIPPGWGPQQQQQQQQVAGSDSLSLITQTPLSIANDLRLVGQVAWSGKTSMEVLVEVSTSSSSSSSSGGGSARWVHRAVAHFVMVLRPTTTSSSSEQPDGGSGCQVPAVVPSSPLEELHFNAAAARAAANRAKRASKRLLSGVEPAGDEVKLLYDLAENQLQRQIAAREQAEALCRQLTITPGRGSSSSAAAAAQGSCAPPGLLAPVPMHTTVQSHLALMHRQDRNNAGSIFGGHLLRIASELAYSTAVLHAGRHCEAVAMGDVTFKQPVPIGCVLEFRAKVVYTAGPLLRVSVVATKHQQLMEVPSELHASVTNDFTFVLAAAGAHPLTPVEPESLREAVQYLAAHRQHVADGYQAPPLLLQEGMEHVLVG